MPPLDLSTLPTEPAEALALLSPALRAQIAPIVAILPMEVQRAALAAVPAVARAMEAGDYAGFCVALEGIGLAMFAPIIWSQAREYIAQHPG